jgi:tetratricopeptide (TPR) repeat protein
MKQEPIDYYKILGIHQTSSIHEIKRSFRQKAKRLHPDIVSGSEKSDTAMKLLLKAYQVLSDPIKRKEYDRLRRTVTVASQFNYRDFLRKREDDFYSQSHLVFYDLLHDKEHDALSLFEKLVYTYNIPIEHYLGREDFMDCAFLLAEEYEKNREYLKAYDLLIKIVLLEYERPYFKHFMEEVIERLKNIACNKLQEKVDPETQIEYLITLAKYDFSPKVTAHLLKKISELYLKLGKIEKARYYLTKSLNLAPGLSGVKKLKKKTAITSS